MRDFMRFGLGVVLAGSFLSFVGCYDEAPPAVPPTTTSEPPAMPPAEVPADREPGEPAPMPTEGNPAAEPGVEGDAASAAPRAGNQSENAKIQAALASLSTEDRELASKQKICPVAGAALGSMGPPIKVEVEGNTVFICCEHCEEPLVSDPAKHLAKIGLEPKAEAAVE